ncbi:hypothetical protein B6U98_02045 [Thermoplasmatales archaeon ex4572_165]|nr:MAG: hypothetical protein B6U98_02045 [Thermoplasmatales archaeon ex4572_165]RLF59592.1 MAG: hypothetical protein DRN27_02065 [Thermoplasmata archaeon]
MEKGKISLSIGNLKINYEGSEKFIKNDFNKIFNLEEICRILKDENVINIPKKRNKVKKQKKIRNYKELQSILKVDNLDDLVISSLAYYYFMKNIDNISKSDLYNLTKNYKKYPGKFKDSLSKLVDKNRIQLKNDKYHLSDKETTKLKKKLKGYF